MDTKHLAVTFVVVVVGVVAAMWLSTKLKMNSFDEFESIS